MKVRKTLNDFGYPRWYTVEVDLGGGDGIDYPQEALSSRTCENCRKFNSKEWVCVSGKEIDNPDCETCDDIDYIEEWLDSSDGFRSPVRCEYDSDKDFEQACKAIKAINRSIKESYERDDMW